MKKSKAIRLVNAWQHRFDARRLPDQSPPSDATFFSRVEDCIAVNSESTCREGFAKSEQDFRRRGGPLRQEGRVRGRFRCRQLRDAPGRVGSGSFFMPMMMGYMMGNAFNRPVYRGPNNGAMMQTGGRFFNVGTFAGAGRTAPFQRAQFTPVQHGVFNTVSMMTTTGFASDDFARWTAVTSIVLVGVTLIGASAGSTSGSIKLVRHIVIAKMLRREIDQTLHPGVVRPLRVQGAVVDERALRAVIVFVFLYLGVCAAGAVAILFDSELQGVPLTAFEAIADAAAMLGGAGSGLGFAGPMGSFEPFSNESTVVLTVMMYLGRLEIIPVLVLFTASHWRA